MAGDYFRIAKVSPERVVYGWASVVEEAGQPIVDLQGDIIAPAELERAAIDYVLKSRDGGEMHERRGVSTLVASLVTTPEIVKALFPAIDATKVPVGWVVAFKIHDDAVWKAVQDGQYIGFSIHGTGQREAVAA